MGDPGAWCGVFLFDGPAGSVLTFPFFCTNVPLFSLLQFADLWALVLSLRRIRRDWIPLRCLFVASVASLVCPEVLEHFRDARCFRGSSISGPRGCVPGDLTSGARGRAATPLDR